MNPENTHILSKIIEHTDSSLVLVFVAVAIAAIIISIPLTRAIIAGRRQRQELMMKREEKIIEVIAGNTAAITGLKTTLEVTVSNIKDGIMRIHDRIDESNKGFSSLKEDTARILEAIGRRNHE